MRIEGDFSNSAVAKAVYLLITEMVFVYLDSVL